MEAYRYQELLYLVVPVMLGMEFFMCAKDEKRIGSDLTLGSYLLEFSGFIFMALIPAVFLFTIWAVETKRFPLQELTLARLDRYGVLFFFMGAWWQVYLFGALRARRMERKDTGRWYLWIPFLGLGFFISIIVLWVSPWNLKWISVIWFLLLFAILNILRVKPKTIEKTMWILAAITFLIENILFLWLESVV